MLNLGDLRSCSRCIFPGSMTGRAAPSSAFVSLSYVCLLTTLNPTKTNLLSKHPEWCEVYISYDRHRSLVASLRNVSAQCLSYSYKY